MRSPLSVPLGSQVLFTRSWFSLHVMDGGNPPGLTRLNERKIAYTAHTGDIINNWIRLGDETPEYEARARDEFQFASDTMDILEDAGMPYGITPGNHDNKFGTTNELYNEYFPPSRYEAASGQENASQDYYGDSWRDGDNQNHFDLIEVGDQELIFLYLGFVAGQEEIDWANDVLAEHRDRKAVFLTHDYLLPTNDPAGRDGELSDGGRAQGVELFEKVVLPNENVFLTLSGHHHGVALNIKRDVGVQGRAVVEMLANYQFYEVEGERRTGHFRLLQFDVSESEVAVNTFSPALEDHNADEFDTLARYEPLADEFTVPVDLVGRSTSFGTDAIGLTLRTDTVIGTDTVASGEEAATTWADRDPGTEYSWYARAADPNGVPAESAAFTFTTAGEPPEDGGPGGGDDDDGPGGGGGPGNDDDGAGDGGGPGDDDDGAGDGGGPGDDDDGAGDGGDPGDDDDDRPGDNGDPGGGDGPGPGADDGPGDDGGPGGGDDDGPGPGPGADDGPGGGDDDDGPGGGAGDDRGQPGGAAVTRAAGAGRTQTAIEVSRATFGDGEADAVVLARPDAFPDALVGTPLAVAENGPLLLTSSGGLEPAVALEIQRVLGADGRVFLLGGTAALGEQVRTGVDALGYEALRFGSATRFGTASLIASLGLGSPSTVLLADGSDFPDAVSAGTAAGAVGGAVLLTGGDTLPEETAAYLEANPDARMSAVGGPAARAVPTAAPLVGATRVGTALTVAEAFFDGPQVVGVATAGDFPDALAGGAAVGGQGGPLLLSSNQSLDAPVAAYLQANDSVDRALLLGGTNALSPAVEDAVNAAITPD